MTDKDFNLMLFLDGQPPVDTEVLRHLSNIAYGCIGVEEVTDDPDNPERTQTVTTGAMNSIPAATVYAVVNELMALRRKIDLINWLGDNHMGWVQPIVHQNGEFYLDMNDPDGDSYRLGTTERLADTMEKIARFLESPLSFFKFYGE
jgi:hypothetical protein